MNNAMLYVVIPAALFLVFGFAALWFGVRHARDGQQDARGFIAREKTSTPEVTGGATVAPKSISGFSR